MNYKRFKQTISGRLCRNCINEAYGVQLKQEDCLYLFYPSPCGRCGSVRNIVMDLELLGRWKIILKRKKKHLDI